jgi:hypothetical protein
MSALPMDQVKPVQVVLQEINTLLDAQDRMFDSIVDVADVRLDGLYAEVDKSVRALKVRAEEIQAIDQK